MPATHALRVAVITGAARGIGRRTAEVLAARGYALALNDLGPLEATRRSVCPLGVPVLEAVGDVSRADEVDRMVELVKARYGRIDVLVNNAGISFIRPAEATPVNDWQRVLDVNLTGPFLLCQGFGKLMLQQHAGAIVNVGSIAGLAGFSDRAAYTASKHGLIGLTKVLAAEWGGRGVRCNAVCPGWVKTEMDLQDQGQGGYSDEDIMRRVPLGRFATPEEVAQAVAFLADPVASGFINGQTLSVDGGWLADGGWDALRLQHRG
jgi:NAD(P)-dependent dehydrogenase (short-subunit alcohol dehydrogenase family)